MPKFVSYIRVSTQAQGQSGLGLEAQQAAVLTHVRQAAGELVASFREVESGTRTDRKRPILRQALEHAKRERATLVIAKLDRLGRNVAFLSALMEGGVDFVACDVPGASRLTLHVLAAVAEAEARAISERTRAALGAAKARGMVLGKPENLTLAAQRKGGAAVRAEAIHRYRVVRPLIEAWRGQGHSLRAIARRLDGIGVETARRGAWTPAQVRRVLRLPEAA
jgi:DNA invertase Pin-like site-specific DNA recombinase